MPRGPATFKQRDVARAIRAVEAAGKLATGVRIGKDGSIEIIISRENAPEPAEADEWEGAKCR